MPGISKKRGDHSLDGFLRQGLSRGPPFLPKLNIDRIWVEKMQRWRLRVGGTSLCASVVGMPTGSIEFPAHRSRLCPRNSPRGRRRGWGRECLL